MQAPKWPKLRAKCLVTSNQVGQWATKRRSDGRMWFYTEMLVLYLASLVSDLATQAALEKQRLKSPPKSRNAPPSGHIIKSHINLETFGLGLTPRRWKCASRAPRNWPAGEAFPTLRLAQPPGFASHPHPRGYRSSAFMAARPLPAGRASVAPTSSRPQLQVRSCCSLDSSLDTPLTILYPPLPPSPSRYTPPRASSGCAPAAPAPRSRACRYVLLHSFIGQAYEH
jgi:hypothetical protein